MADFVWKDDYSVGVEVLDKQHQEFIVILNDLDTAITQTKTPGMFMTILDELTKHMDLHFATEEKYFDEFNYADKDVHKKAHTDFRSGVAKIYADYGDNLEVLSFTLKDYLEKWLSEHTANMDKKYTKCFNDHGLR